MPYPKHFNRKLVGKRVAERRKLHTERTVNEMREARQLSHTIVAQITYNPYLTSGLNKSYYYHTVTTHPKRKPRYRLWKNLDLALRRKLKKRSSR